MAQNSKFQRLARVPEISGNFQKIWNFEILSSRSILVTKIEWELYLICWYLPKTANSWEFPDFSKISGNILAKLEFWNFEFKIDISDQKCVELIPNMLQFAQNSNFQRISRFPEDFWKNFWKTGILKFWAQNPFQWLKLSGNDTQYVGIGPKLQILENF